jgi:hypothetical protein
MEVIGNYLVAKYRSGVLVQSLRAARVEDRHGQAENKEKKMNARCIIPECVTV